MTTKWVLLIALSSLGLGCVFGAHVGSFRPANSPNGTVATLLVERTTVNGELLEVRDSGLVVLNNREVTFVPYRAIGASKFKQIGVHLSGGRSPTEAQRSELQLVSRFPQGLTRDMERKLLDVYHQTSITFLDR